MLYIKEEGQDALLSWHVGEPLPHLSRQVITFLADGDELEMILDAMKRTVYPGDPMTSSEFREWSRAKQRGS